MLQIRQVKHLARKLDTPVERLYETIDDVDGYYEELVVLNPHKPDKPRNVVSVKGRIRQLQSRLYRRVLLRCLTPSPYSQGGVRGRHIKSNAEPHRRSAFVFKADISNFYPTVHYSRAYRLFTEKFRCSPDVARVCTRLCTYRHHLAMGLITSPIIADQILGRVDSRIGAACHKAGLVYTRYVDDVTISGPYDLQQSGFEQVVSEILSNDGFMLNASKNQFGELSKKMSITNIRIVRGKLDVQKEYVNELERQLDDAWRLANGQPFDGPYYTQGQIRGRVQFVCWVNPGRRSLLMAKFKSISWQRVAEAGRDLGLVATKKGLHKSTEFAPNTK